MIMKGQSDDEPKLQQFWLIPGFIETKPSVLGFDIEK